MGEEQISGYNKMGRFSIVIEAQCLHSSLVFEM